MRAALALFRDELFAYRHFLALATAVSLLPLVAPLVAPAGTSRTDLRALVALIGATAIGVLLSVALGTGLFARDLASGRIRYWLTRPVSVPALWLGRTGAALSCLYAAIAIALLPAALLGDLSWIASDSSTNLQSTSFSLLSPSVAVALSFGLLFFLAQGLMLFERSRSRWLLLDLAGLVTVVLVLSATLARLQRASSWFASLRVVFLIGLALLVGLAFGSLMALTRGRSDLVRSHRAFSLTLWSVLVVATAALAGYTRGFLAPEPKELLIDRTFLFAPADANWFALSGQMAGRPGMSGLFLCEDARRGCRFLGFDYPWLFDGVASSRDRSRLAWFSFVDRELVRYVATVGGVGTAGGVGDTDARISLPLGSGRWVAMSQAFSSDGRHLAQLDAERLTLFDTTSGAVELTMAHPGHLERPRRVVRFADDQTLVTVGFEVTTADSAAARRVEVVAHALDLRERRVSEIGRATLPGPDFGFGLWISPSGRMAALRSQNWQSPSAPALLVRLEDGLPSLPDEALASTSSMPAWLPDNRVIWTTHTPAGSRLHLLDPDGHTRAFDLPRSERFDPVAVCGTLLVASVSERSLARDREPEGRTARRSLAPSETIAEWRALAIDLSTGAVRELGGGLRAIRRVGQDRALGTRALFVDARARVVELEATTGAERVWLPATTSAGE